MVFYVPKTEIPERIRHRVAPEPGILILLSFLTRVGLGSFLPRYIQLNKENNSPCTFKVLPSQENVTILHERTPFNLLSESNGHDQGEVEMDAFEEEAPACRHGCFGVFKFPWKQSSSENEDKLLLGGFNSSTKEVTWWRKKLNKARESMVVYGGPEWKNLVRKIGAYCRGCRMQKVSLWKKQKPKNRFHYDMDCYNLNFDNDSDGRDGENPVAYFAARFAAPSSFISKRPVVDHQ